MANLNFNILHIIEESKSTGERYLHPTLSTFEAIDLQFNILIDGVYYEVVIEKSNDYLWIALDFGKPNPRDEHLTNIITGEKRENEREITEAELIGQFFCLYDYKTTFFYISNIKKKNVILTIFKEKLKLNFIFQTIQKTKEEFIELLNKVSEISFTEVKHLFSHNSKKRQALKDLTGVDAPKEFTIKALYDKSNSLVEFLKELFTEKENDSLKDLIIRGSDESSFEIIFNNDTFNKKIELKSVKDENGKFISNEIKDSLLKELK